MLDGYYVAPSKEALFSQSDVLSLHLQCNDSTRHTVKHEDLSRMKTTALLVNTSHAELIETDALVSALNRGRPGMAAVDTYEIEPNCKGMQLPTRSRTAPVPRVQRSPNLISRTSGFAATLHT